MDKRQKLTIIAALLVAGVTFLVFLPTLRNGFVNWDDDGYIYKNTFIRGIDVILFRSAFLNFNMANWHPLTWISHAVDYALWGMNPVGHHLTNNILHAINTMIVVLLVVGLLQFSKSTEGKDGNGARSDDMGPIVGGGVAGLLFGLHPLHVESVAWISERKDVLCTLFFLLSLSAYLKYIKTSTEGKKSESWLLNRHYLYSLTLFFLALLSKPMAVTLPVVLLILDWFPLERTRSQAAFKHALEEKYPFFVLSLLSSIITIVAQKTGDAIVSLESTPFLTRVIVGAKALIMYLWKMIVPVDLSPFYPYPKDASLFSLEYLLPVLLVIGLTAACLAAAKRQKLWLAAWGYYIITVLPVLGLIQVGRQSMADRYTYIPSIGPFFLAGLGVSLIYGSGKKAALGKRGPSLKAVSAGVAVVLIPVLIYLTLQQIGIWKNSVVLWTYVIEKENVRIPQVYNSLGVAYRDAGQYDMATKNYNIAIALNPAYSEAYYNRGIIYTKEELPDNAVEDFTKAIAVNPKLYQAYYNRGVCFFNKGMINEAIEDFNAAIAINPYYLEAYFNRGLAYGKKGFLDKAIADFSKAIDINPRSDEAYNTRGISYGKKGQFDLAVADFSRAIELNPNLCTAYNNLGSAYYLNGQYTMAVRYFDKAVAMDASNGQSYVNRGYAYLKTGDEKRAREDFQQGCALGNKIGCGALPNK